MVAIDNQSFVLIEQSVKLSCSRPTGMTMGWVLLPSIITTCQVAYLNKYVLYGYFYELFLQGPNFCEAVEIVSILQLQNV